MGLRVTMLTNQGAKHGHGGVATTILCRRLIRAYHLALNRLQCPPGQSPTCREHYVPMPTTCIDVQSLVPLT